MLFGLGEPVRLCCLLFGHKNLLSNCLPRNRCPPQVHRLPVVNDEKQVVGIVTQNDIFGALGIFS